MKAHLIQQSSIYLLSNIINKAIPFFLLPIYTHYLTPVEFGVYALFQVIISFTTPLINMNLGSHVTRNIHKKTKNEMRLISCNVYFNLTFCLCAALFILIFIETILDIGFAEHLGFSKGMLFVAPLLAAGSAINLINLTFLRNQERATTYAGIEFARTTINAVLLITAIVVLDKSWESIVFAQLISLICVIWLYFFFMCDPTTIQFKPSQVSWPVQKEIFRISAPMIPHALATAVILYTDRLFIEHYYSSNEVGVYSLGYQYGLINAILIDSAILAWSPWFYKKILDKNNYPLIVRNSYLFIWFTVLSTLITAFALPLILTHIIDSSYSQAINIVAIIAGANFLYGFYKLMFPYLVHKGQTSFLGISSTVAALANVFANVWLVPIYGIEGAAYSTIIAFLVSSLIVGARAQYLHPMPWFGSSK